MNLQTILLKVLSPVLNWIPKGWITAIGIVGLLVIFMISPESPVEMFRLLPGDKVAGWVSLLGGLTGVGLMRKEINSGK